MQEIQGFFLLEIQRFFFELGSVSLVLRPLLRKPAVSLHFVNSFQKIVTGAHAGDFRRFQQAC